MTRVGHRNRPVKSGTTGIGKARGERCKAFWEHLIARYPLEASLRHRMRR